MTIVLDLDHCLIYASYSELEGLPLIGKRGYLHLYHRPWLSQFLTFLAKMKNWDIVFYTSSKAYYARWVIKSMSVPFEYQLFSRSKTKKKYTETGEVYLKSLAKNEMKVEDSDRRTIVLDDRPDLWDETGVELVAIDPWHGELSDTELEQAIRRILKRVHNHNRMNFILNLNTK